MQERTYLFHIFGDAGPKIARLPHLVTVGNRVAMLAVLDSTNEPAGIWGDRPPHDASGSGNTWGLGLVEEFRLWSLPVNQLALRERESHTRLGQFTCIIPQSTPDYVLDALKDAAKGAVYIDNTWGLLVSLLTDIGWFFAPLGDEIPLAVFCSHKERLVKGVSMRLCELGQESTQVIETDQGETWHLTANQRTLCGLNSGDGGDSPTAIEVAKAESSAALTVVEQSTKTELEKVADSVRVTHDAWIVTVTSDTSLIQTCRLVASATAKKLQIIACLDVTDRGLSQLPITQQLESMKLTYPVSGRGLSALSRQPNLRELSLVDIRVNDSMVDDLAAFAVFKSLRRLEISLGHLSLKALEQITSQPHLDTVIVDGETVRRR